MSNPHLRFHSSTVALLAATVVALLLLVHPRAEASLDWQPTRTWVFVVGTLEWENAEALPPFPKDKRRDLQLVNFFKKAGVADDQIIYLQDQEATLATIQDQLNDFLPKASEGDLLIVYYCGHGYPSGDDPKRIIMASYDASPDEEGWSYEALVKAIERHFKGDRALIISDCCHAGGAIGAAKRNGKRVSYSTLGSSTFSQESTANWTYTESVLAAFRGSPAVDLDSDGWITLGETQQFAR
ncbi:MAG TPA: caspase family protein, partial [Chthoniobacteraceae bacterium]